MQEKISLYEELLTLEPGSKLFMPLAKMYIAESQHDKAVAVLQKGLGMHPDFFAARLLLISALEAMTGKEKEMQEQVGLVWDNLQSCSGLWSGLEALLKQQNKDEAALGLRLFTQALQGKGMDWGLVISKGLEAVLDISVSLPLPAVSDLQEEKVAPQPEINSAEQEVSLEQESTAEEDEPIAEEEPGVRTKTMADLLIQQGEYAQAVEIYEELLDRTPDSKQRKEIQESLEKAKQELSSDDSKNGKNSENDALLSTLSALADRFEARAGNKKVEK